MEQSLAGNGVTRIMATDRTQVTVVSGSQTGFVVTEAMLPQIQTYIDAPPEGVRGDAGALRAEMARVFGQLGVEVGPTQAGVLEHSYGAGTPALRDMVADGVLSSAHHGESGLTWTLNWPSMNLERLAGAILQLGSGSADSSQGITAKELERALDSLLGLPGALPAQTAQQIVTLYGEGGRITQPQLVQVLSPPGPDQPLSEAPLGLVAALDSGAARPSVGPIGLPAPGLLPDGSRDWATTHAAMVNYVMSFAGPFGQLTQSQFAQAVASLPAAGAVPANQVANAMFGRFGSGSPVLVLTRPEIEAMVRSRALLASPRANGSYGILLNPGTASAVQPGFSGPEGEPTGGPEIQGVMAVNGVTAQDGAAPQAAHRQREREDDRSDRSYREESLGNEGFRQELMGLGLNATIFGALSIDYDRLQQRKRHSFSDLMRSNLAKLPPDQIATAIFHEAGRDPETERLPTEEFEAAVRSLTEDKQALAGGGAEVLVRLANTPILAGPDQEGSGFQGDSISHGGIAALFDRRIVEILAGLGTKAYVVQDNPATAFADPALIAAFLATYAMDPAATLQEAEVAEALGSRAFRDPAAADPIAARLCLLLADRGAEPVGIPPENLRKSIDAGVLALGPVAALGLRVDMARLPPAVVADAMFRHFGLDPARDALSAQQFDAALEQVTGAAAAISPEDADFLVREYGSDLDDGAGRLTQADIVAILKGELRLDGSQGGPVLRVENQIDPRHRKPAYTNPANWDTGAALSGSYANDLVLAVAQDTGLALAEVIKVVGNIGAWSLRLSEAGQQVYASLRRIWAEAGADVLSATRAMVLRLKADAGLTAGAQGLLDAACTRLAARDFEGGLLLELFWNDRTGAVALANAVAASARPGQDRSAGASSLLPALASIDLSAVAYQRQTGRMRYAW